MASRFCFLFKCLPLCFFSHLCFLQIVTLSSSFQAILSHTIWKPGSFSFHPFCLTEWTLPSQYSYNCDPHGNAYYKWYTWKLQTPFHVWVVVLLENIILNLNIWSNIKLADGSSSFLMVLLPFTNNTLWNLNCCLRKGVCIGIFWGGVVCPL